MAVPARRVSKTRKRKRRTHMNIDAKTTTKCPTCGAIIKPHRVCKECGSYKNKKVIKTEEE